MRYIIFNEMFGEPILRRKKLTTIRAAEKPPGFYSLRVWSGAPYRSKQVEFVKALLTSPCPIRIEAGSPVVVSRRPIMRTIHPAVPPKVLVGEQELDREERECLGKAEGFASFDAFLTFFTTMHRLPFQGYIHIIVLL